MSRDIMGKIAKGETLDDDDIKYAVDRGMELPEEYDVQAASYTDPGNFGTPTGNVVETGPAFSQPPQSTATGMVTLDADKLSGLTNDALDQIADAVGMDVPAKKAEKVLALTGGVAPSGETEEDEESE